MAGFELALHVLLNHEGGYVNDKRDPGGATNYGVSLRWLRSQNIIDADLDDDGDVDEHDVRLLSRPQVAELYRRAFWEPNNVQDIESQRVAIMLFGLIVNTGPKRAVKMLQEALNVSRMRKSSLLVDGWLGPKTMEAINSTDSTILINHYKKIARAFYSNIVRENPILDKFLVGWFRRVSSY